MYLSSKLPMNTIAVAATWKACCKFVVAFWRAYQTQAVVTKYSIWEGIKNKLNNFDFQWVIIGYLRTIWFDIIRLRYRGQLQNCVNDYSLSHAFCYWRWNNDQIDLYAWEFSQLACHDIAVLVHICPVYNVIHKIWIIFYEYYKLKDQFKPTSAL